MHGYQRESDGILASAFFSFQNLKWYYSREDWKRYTSGYGRWDGFQDRNNAWQAKNTRDTKHLESSSRIRMNWGNISMNESGRLTRLAWDREKKITERETLSRRRESRLRKKKTSLSPCELMQSCGDPDTRSLTERRRRERTYGWDSEHTLSSHDPKDLLYSWTECERVKVGRKEYQEVESKERTKVNSNSFFHCFSLRPFECLLPCSTSWWQKHATRTSCVYTKLT